MKNFVISLFAVVMLGAVSVSYADNCQDLSADFTDKVEQMSNVDSKLLEQAQLLHDEGMTLHNGGDHAGSVAKLDEALQLLVDAE